MTFFRNTFMIASSNIGKQLRAWWGALVPALLLLALWGADMATLVQHYCTA